MGIRYEDREYVGIVKDECGQPRAAVHTRFLGPTETGCGKSCQEGRGLILGQVIEKIDKIYLKPCHSCPMQYDIMVL